MVDRHLYTFIQVADSGSFLKAAEKLYVSANAVTKQINLLESDLGVRLFTRSAKGLALTDAGNLIYHEAEEMIRRANSAIQRARAVASQEPMVVRIGVSLMNPTDIILELWERVASQHPNMRLEVVPFEDSAPAFQEVLRTLGEKIDLIACAYQTSYWGDRYRSFHLKDIPLCVSCAGGHPLTQKSILAIADLYGETLHISKRGISESIDSLRDELEQHPQIRLIDHEFVEYNNFNRLAASNELLLSYEHWSSVHPLLKTLPVDWRYTMPYGLIYTKSPSKALLDFILAIGKA